jgi:flavodoxin/NAD-dependent dihydropyrimidine dehydrogenase PreA subunit
MSDQPTRALIVSFSQTGNTRQVAEAIGRGLQTRGVDVRHADLLKTDPAEVAEYDLVGIGSPVFYYKEPANVREFIARLPSAKRKAAFTFITHGGNPVNTLRRMQKQLHRRGYTVINSVESLGYDTYPMFFRTFRDWGHPTADELQTAEDFGERLMREVRWFAEEQRFATPKYRFVGGKYFVLSLLCQGGMMKRMFPALGVKDDLCTRCGACARACPVGAITLDPTPKVGDACIWCYQCERICPEQAFDCDWSKLREKMGC